MSCKIKHSEADKILSNLIGIHEELIKDLRGSYEEDTGEVLDLEGIVSDPKIAKEVAKKLERFNRKSFIEDSKKRAEKKSTPKKASNSEEYRKLMAAFPDSIEREDRIALIAHLFTLAVDKIQSEYIGVDREAIIAGFIDGAGNKIGGPAALLRLVKINLQGLYNEAKQRGNKYKVQKLALIAQNFDPLVTMALFNIRYSEGMDINPNFTYAHNVSKDNDIENDDIWDFSIEESTAEHWNESKDSISPFNSTSILVRRVLSKAPKVGEFDDLGFPRRENPVKCHQRLVEILKGIQSETDMVNRLMEEAYADDYIEYILNQFKKDPVLRTQFYVDFSKNFQKYSKMSWKKGKPKFQILNFMTEKIAFGNYLSAVKTRGLFSNLTSIFRYDESGNAVVDRTNFLDFITTINKAIGKIEEQYDVTQGKFLAKQVRYHFNIKGRELDFYQDIFNRLGINISSPDLKKLLKNKRALRAINRALRSIPELLNDAVDGADYESFLKKTIGQNQKKGVLEEKIGKIIQAINTAVPAKNVLFRIRYQGNNYFSNVQSSYLGRLFDRISYHADSFDSEGLKDWIEQTYFKSSLFRDPITGRIYNKWLEDLYNNIFSEDGNDFASQFTYIKFLGDNDNKFDNFKDKKQVAAQLTAYFAESDSYGWYPVFVMGDSGASKYIRAPRYSEEEILEGIFSLYLQETEFQKQLQEFVKSRKEAGVDMGNLEFISKDPKYTLLQFLQEDKYLDMIDLNNLEESVKKATKEYFKDAFNNFYANVVNCGAISLLDKSVSEYINAEGKKITGEEALLHNLKDYYWNSQFAMMCQMNILTVNPIFYKGGDTTDLQKRFKQIHASGNVLSTEAEDPFTGTKYSASENQTVVYFKDIKVNPEETNGEFMKVIEKLYGKDSDIYNKYKNGTSLTDGQGYRTLASYRKVLGMAGKWNKKTEIAYRRLEELRQIIRNTGTITPEISKEIESLMLVLQPLKPFSYSLEEVTLGNSTFLIPVQIKYAETVVIPELLPEGKLKSTMLWAEENEVDLVCATTAVKVGEFGAADISEASDGKSTWEALDKAEKHHSKWKDMVLQTNLPDHVHGSQLFATQSRKIILNGIKEFNDEGKPIFYDDYVGSSSLMLGDEMVNMTAPNLISFYVSLISANILEDLDSFVNEISDPEKVRDILMNMTISNNRESKDNLIAFSKDPNAALEQYFLQPLYEGGIEHDTASYLLSIFKKKVNKQKILGGNGVQVSAFGINGYEEDNNLQFVCSYDEDGNPDNILYAECEIPFDLSYTDKNGRTVKLNFDDYCNPDGTLKQGKNGSLLEEQFPGITSFIAYRIPTEEKYSMLNMKVVRFSRKVNGGGIIKVPAQGTTIAGFDFDADKLFFMKREYKMKTKSSIKDALKEYFKEFPEVSRELKAAKKTFEATDKLLSGLFSEELDDLSILDYVEGAREEFEAWYAANMDRFVSFETYDYSKNPWDKSNTRVARNNMLINIIQKRLEDPQTLKERTTPGGFDHIKSAAKLMRQWFGIEGVNYIYSDPWTMIIYNQQNQVADKLIGVFANQNANHNIAMLMSKFELVNEIAFGKHSATGLKDLKNPDSLTKELLAAAVDSVKDPQLIFLNLNTTTATAASLLCRLGYDFEEIGALFNQPIIKDFCKYCDDYEFSDFDTAIANIASQNNWNIDLRNPEYNSAVVSFENLEYAIKEYKRTGKKDSVRYIQGEVLKLFVEIYKAAQEVSDFVTNTKFTASNAVKSTFGGMYAQQDKVSSYNTDLKNKESKRLVIVVNDLKDNYEKPYIDSPVSDNFNISDRESYFKRIRYNPFGYEQAMYDANKEAIKALGKYFPYGNRFYTAIRHFMRELSAYNLNEDTINDIHEHIMKYALSIVDHSMFDPDGIVRMKVPEIEVDGDEEKEVINIINISNKEYYTQYVPYKVVKTLQEHPEYRNKYAILNYLTVNIDGDTPIMNLGDNGALEDIQKEAVRDSWAALLEDPALHEMAIDLYMYSYYNSGFGFGTIGFNHLCPTAVKQALKVGDESYLDFLYGLLHKDSIYNSIDKNLFAVNFIKAHKDNRAFVYTPKDIQLTTLRKIATGENKVLKDSFTIDLGSKEFDFKFLKMKPSAEGTFVMPAINIDGALYICNLDRIDSVADTGNAEDIFNYVSKKSNKVTYTRVEDTSIDMEGSSKANYVDSGIYQEMYTKEELEQFDESFLWEELVRIMPSSMKAEGSTTEEIIEDLKEEYGEDATKDNIIDTILSSYDSSRVVDKGTGKFTC